MPIFGNPHFSENRAYPALHLDPAAAVFSDPVTICNSRSPVASLSASSVWDVKQSKTKMDGRLPKHPDKDPWLPSTDVRNFRISRPGDGSPKSELQALDFRF